MKLVAENDKQVSKKKKLNSMKALSMLDNIITRTDDDDEPANENSSAVDETPEDSNLDMFDSLTKTLDSILLSSKNENQAEQTIQSKKVSNISKEMVRKASIDSCQDLNVNDTIYTTANVPIKVLEIVPSFEHIPTYSVRFMGQIHILKWYNKSITNDLQGYQKYLQELANDKSYPSSILMPKAFTKEDSHGCFGCIFTDVTHDYFTLKDIINGYIVEYDEEHIPRRRSIKFKNMNAMVTAAIKISEAFLKLKEKLEHFYSFYDENLLVNITTGDILLDISNSISKQGNVLHVDRQCVYLAPEVLSGSVKPNPNSDNHILAVLLFRIFLHDHPLEGKSVIDDTSLDVEETIKYYSEQAVFVLDPEDDSNRPVRGVHFTVLSMWDKYPQYLKDAFTKAFCDNLFSFDFRYSPEDWLKILMHLKSDLLNCICGRVDFSFLYEMTQEAFYKCQRCGSKYHSLYFKRRDYSIPIFDNNNIYATFLKDKISSYDEVMGTVIENKIHNNLFGLKNVSTIDWKCQLPNGESKDIRPDEVLPIFANTQIDFFGSLAEFDFVGKDKK
jgi:hypothetical protein